MLEENVNPYVVYRSRGSRQTIPRQTKHECQMVLNGIEKHKLGQEGKDARKWKICLKQVCNLDIKFNQRRPYWGSDIQVKT